MHAAHSTLSPFPQRSSFWTSSFVFSLLPSSYIFFEKSAALSRLTVVAAFAPDCSRCPYSYRAGHLPRSIDSTTRNSLPSGDNSPPYEGSPTSLRFSNFSRLFSSIWPGSVASLDRVLEGTQNKFQLIDWWGIDSRLVVSRINLFNDSRFSMANKQSFQTEYNKNNCCQSLY